jgi:hypothetical protein
MILLLAVAEPALCTRCPQGEYPDSHPNIPAAVLAGSPPTIGELLQLTNRTAHEFDACGETFALTYATRVLSSPDLPPSPGPRLATVDVVDEAVYEVVAVDGGCILLGRRQ